MLVEFKVENFLSYKNEVTLSMVAAPITENAQNVLPEKEGLPLLKTAILYGANSSGKSNLFQAMEFMKDLVINSSKESQADEPIRVEPFKLSESTEEAPSSFEVTFIQDDTLFRYGFSTNTKKITEEWLYSRLNVKELKLFYRKNNKITFNEKYFEEGSGLDKKTREDALFLSVVANFSGDLSLKIIKWFTNLRIFSAKNDEHYMDFSIGKLESDEIYRKKTISLLNSVGIKIENLIAKTVKLEENSIPPFLPRAVKHQILKKGILRLSVCKKKYNDQGQECGLTTWDISKESDGTQKIIGLAGPIFDSLKNNRVLVIDEFDTRLHPLMAKMLVSLFHSPEINFNKAQLIFATHDTNLLSSDLFRRDQIWFCEKDQFESTDLYSLAEYKLRDNNQKVRKDADYEKNYIAGKYGAIPYINIETLKSFLS